MQLDKKYKDILDQLKKNNQQHLLAFWDQLSKEQKSVLLADIEDLDFAQINKWVENYVKTDSPAYVPADFDPAPYYPAQPADDKTRQKYEKACQTGEKLLKAGKVAGFVVAGGQGTRLGYDGPKGNFPIGPVTNRTLFEIFAQNIVASRSKYNANLPWYVMTSPLNHEKTVEIFEKNSYFGLPRKDIYTFQQGTLPNFNFDGQILLAEKHRLARSPDGHGGSLKALFQSGAVAHMQKRGIEYISYWQVDNALINIFDPLFIGLHALDGSEMSSKALKKTGPLEKVGNFCSVNGAVNVIEYSDLPDEQANKLNPDGSLAFDLASIGIHMLSRTFIEKLNAADGFALPIHRAVKKIPYINSAGQRVQPDKPNGVKLETFVFDALPMAQNSIILETIRSEEFAPAKNASGVDSAQTAKEMIVERAACWLESAGIVVPRTAEGKPDCVIEIAPAFALDKEDIDRKKNQIPPINPGDKIYIK